MVKMMNLVCRSHAMAHLLVLPLLLLAACALPGEAQHLLTKEGPQTASLDLGNGFSVLRDSDQLAVKQNERTIWTTLPGERFISASAGNDSVTGSNGAFKIEEVDLDRCQDQTVSSVSSVAWDDTFTGSAAQIAGELLQCGDSNASFTLTFWVPSDLPDRVAFYLAIQQPQTSAWALKKLYLSFSSHPDEDFYGLGAQASFASLKNQSVPVFSREQGVGRGDEPITSIENANGSFAGGDRLTTYTAIPSYISTENHVFYLSEKSTAYANFDFTNPDAVTVRYDSLSVDGAFMRAEDMFGAVEMLTAYTGRQPHLPEWVDSGAILGIQGGEEKVNRIVEQGLEIGCPIAGVWLQDWEGTHSQVKPSLEIFSSGV